jgi:hypothetical protein
VTVRLPGEPRPAALLRRGLLGLTALGLVGTTIELVFLRHWSTAAALIVWPGVLVLGFALAILVTRPRPAVLRAVRACAAVALVIALVGVGLHVAENLTAGPLDRVYAGTWDSMSTVSQWWTAITGGVGPAPALAPGALAEIALGLLLATVAWPLEAVTQP